MAAELLLVADRRRDVLRSVPPDGQDQPGRRKPADPVHLYQFFRSDGETRQYSRPVPAHERPPARSVKQ
jgi:hypothetical protein